MKQRSPNPHHASRLLALLFLLALPILVGCGKSKDDSTASTSGPPAPVEDLYNNGVDALNAQRYSSANDQFNGNVDNFTLNSTTFNFDPAVATPLPAALPMFLTGLAGLGLLARRRRKQAA